MENSYLITGSENIIKKIEELTVNHNINTLNCNVADPSYLSLNALSPSEVTDLWEIITVMATIGGAIGFIKEIKSLVVNSNNKDSSIVIRTNKGSTINISSETTEVEIKEFAEKTIIKIK